MTLEQSIIDELDNLYLELDGFSSNTNIYPVDNRDIEPMSDGEKAVRERIAEIESGLTEEQLNYYYIEVSLGAKL